MRRITWLILPLLSTLALAATMRAGEGGTEVTLDTMKSKTPANWKSAKPANKFRAYQFTIPKAAGDDADAEVAIFFFGAGSGGSADENIGRWKKMFTPPDGKTIEEASKVETFKVGSAAITYLDVNGTYITKFPPFDPKAKEMRFPDYRMLGVYFGCENGPYFIRLTGPAKTVEGAKKGFDSWVKNFK